MKSSGRRRNRLAAALVAALGLLGAGGAPAQESATVETLAREVAALRAEIAALRAAQTAAALAELERRIELLAGEIERLAIGAAAPVAGAEPGGPGLGPAASKVYQVAGGLSIGGYGEMVYQGVADRRDDGAPAGRSDELDFLRAVVYVGYKWNDDWLFNSELEWEHAKAGEAQRGEVAVEFAYVERRIRPAVNARAGLLLLPMGLANELHEPTTFLATRRPGVESAILPTTWRENGLGLFGEIGPLTYRSYVVNGLEARRFAASGLRAGRQNGARALAEDLAWVGRVDWTAVPGLLAGASAYLGDSGQDLRDGLGAIEVGTRIVEGHAEWRAGGLALRALWTRAELGDVARLNAALGLAGERAVGERLQGAYLEAGYDLLGRAGASRQALTPFLRWESYDTQARVPPGFRRDPANEIEILTLGVAWKPFEQLVVKADWQEVDNRAGTGLDQLNLGLGYVF